MAPSKSDLIRQHFAVNWSPFYAKLVDLPAGANGSITIRSPLRRDDHTPSFTINLSGERAGRWKDWGTGAHGDAFDLYGRIRGLEAFNEILDSIVTEFGIAAAVSNGTKRPKANELTKSQKHKPTPEEAREKAKEIWQAATTATADHAYLRGKGIGPHGLRVNDDGELVVRVTDSKVTHSLQFIHPDGSKRFLYGGRKKACYAAFGKPSDSLVIVEGLATGISVFEATNTATAVAFDAGNLLPAAETLRAKYPDLVIIICADDDIDKTPNTGMTSASVAAEAVSGRLAIPNFGENRPEGASDFNDMHQIVGLEAVRAAIERAKPVTGPEPVTVTNLLDTAGVVADLDGVNAITDALRQLSQSLKEVGADQLMRAAAQVEATARLKAAGVASPASMVKAALVIEAKHDGDAEGRGGLLLADSVPWEEPVDGAELMTKVVQMIVRYSVLPEGAVTAISLWVIFAHAHDRAVVSPLLSVTSPTKRCGKSTLMSILDGLVPRSLSASNITSAALFRSVEAYHPTLLIDEADTFIKDHDDLRGILNSGHTRPQAFVIRCDGDDHEPRAFSTWCPKVVALIGQLPDTLADRSINISMRRKGPGERTEKLRLDRLDLEDLQRMAARWVADHGDELRSADPDVPESLGDRAADNWRFLLAIV